MARRRFSRIRQAPRLTTALTALRAWEDARGTRPRVARPAGSRPGGLIRLQVNPFGLGDSDLYIVRASRRANTIMGTGIGTRAANPVAGAITVGGFVPAKAILFQGTGTSTSATSEITNLSYERRAGASYTHPFGSSTGTETEFEAQSAITTALLGNNENRSISFQPERQYRN